VRRSFEEHSPLSVQCCTFSNIISNNKRANTSYDLNTPTMHPCVLAMPCTHKLLLREENRRGEHAKPAAEFFMVQRFPN
jgi:hypothetical protein